MFSETRMKEMNSKVVAIQAAAAELHHMADDFPAIARNAVRILASVKMLQLNLSDIVNLEAQQNPAWNLLKG